MGVAQTAIYRGTKAGEYTEAAYNYGQFCGFRKGKLNIPLYWKIQTETAGLSNIPCVHETRPNPQFNLFRCLLISLHKLLLLAHKGFLALPRIPRILMHQLNVQTSK
jgi:hypothetical protein